MIHTIRERAPAWPPEAGRTRSTIAGLVVDWSVSQPTEAEVLAAWTPSDADKTAANKQAAQQTLAGTTPADFRFRAMLRVLYRSMPALRTAFPTMARFRAAVAAEIAAETDPNQ